MVICIAIHRLQVSGQMETVHTWTHSYWQGLRCENNLVPGINGQGPMPSEMKQRKRLSTIFDKS